MTESTEQVPSGDLTARLDAGPVICAEGFLFELERRGYLSAGEFVPEVALEYPDALRTLHVDYQRAGSDVVEAFTYNGHREKMRVIGKEDLLEPLNRSALQIAREVADQRPGDLMAGNISNTNIWDPEHTARQDEVRGMFEEMVGWAVDDGADMIIGETFYYAGEALAALEVAKAAGLPVVVTIAPMAIRGDGRRGRHRRHVPAAGAGRRDRGGHELLPRARDDAALAEADPRGRVMPRRRLADPLPDHVRGTDVLQPQRRPRTGAVAARPHLPDRAGSAVRHPVRDRRVRQGGLRPRHPLPRRLLRCVADARPQTAEAVGKTTEASRFSENMRNHFMYGDNERLPEHIVALGDDA